MPPRGEKHSASSAPSLLVARHSLVPRICSTSRSCGTWSCWFVDASVASGRKQPESTKLQHPSTREAPEKHQAPNFKPGSLALGASLFGVSLELGAWNLELSVTPAPPR